jgi:hypothetical protein
MLKIRTYILCISFILSTFISFGGKIEKGFYRLKIYDYFSAKNYFEKSLKRKTSPAAFGLATIYSRNDNPFYSLDSAYVYIQKAEVTFPKMKEAWLVQYSVYGFSKNAIDSLKQVISTCFFKRTIELNSVSKYQQFIEMHPFSNEFKDAVFKRDSLAFSIAKSENNSLAFAYFLSAYPTSEFASDANDFLMKSQYSETTKAGTLQSYETFLNAFPLNNYKEEAEEKVYQMVTKPNTIVSLEKFITSYPENHKLNAAWGRLYQLNVFEYSSESITQFSTKYPDYPFLEDLQFDLDQMGNKLFPYQRSGKFGFMNDDGVSVIAPNFSTVAPFKEGLAIVSKNGKYGYINKKGEIVIDLYYDSGLDFEKGRAIVGISERYGMIDRTGSVLIEPHFKDLGNLSEDLIYGLKDSLYGYYNSLGQQVVGERFTEAFSFSNGLAKVEEKGLQAYIDEKGKYVVHPAFEEIEFFSDSLLVYGDGESYGLMKRTCEIVVPNKYEKIGKLSDGLAIFVFDEYLGYLNSRGEVVIPAMYDLVPNYLDQCQFGDGAAVVSKDEMFGIINSKGKEIVPFKYNNLGKWSDLIAADKNGKWGYINRANVMVIPPTFDFAESFVGVVGLVEQTSLSGAINKKGDKIVETGYNNVEFVNKAFLIVNNGALYGLTSSSGENLLPMIYRSIRVFDDNYLILENNEGLSYFDCTTKFLLTLNKTDE